MIIPKTIKKLVGIEDNDSQDPTTWSDAKKLKLLLALTGKQDRISRVHEEFGFAYVMGDQKIIHAVRDHSRDEWNQIYDSAQSLKTYLKMDLKEHEYHVWLSNGEEMLALLVTSGMYIGFHDKMGFAIQKRQFYIDWLLWQRTPNYRHIRSVLKQCGYNISEDLAGR